MNNEEKKEHQVAGWGKLFTVDGLPLWLPVITILSLIVYGMGYMTWATYAMVNGLGFLPAIREQYFVAGIIPFALMLLFFFILSGSFSITKRYADTIQNLSRTISIIISFCIVIFSMTALLLMSLRYVFHYAISEWLINFFWIICIIITAIQAHEFKESNKVRMFKIYLPIQWIFVFYVAQNGYERYIFPSLAREFGGPKEACVQLDLTRENISPQTLTLISDSATRTNSSNVFRTLPLYLIFDGGDLVLLKQKSGKIDSTNALLKIKREVIQGIYNCESSI